MRHRSITWMIGLVSLISFSGTARATITFTQIDDDVFVVSHRVKLIGSRGKAMNMVYTKAASLCIAAGFSHYQVMQQESQAAQEEDAANASVQVRFFHEAGEDRLDCSKKADPDYVREAEQKLAKKGYVPFEAPQQVAADEGSVESPESPCASACTLEQIAAMARSGLADEQIRAACSSGG